MDIPKGQVNINQEKLEQAARWDGLRGIVAWGLDEVDAVHLLRQYQRLW